MAATLTSPIVRAGGKRRLLPQILPLIAARPHECFVEAFGGGLSVTLNKPRSKVEVINDVDEDLVTFYKVAKHHARELRRVMHGQINSRALFQAARRKPEHETDIHRAARFWFLNACSFGADAESFGVIKTSGGTGAGSSWRGKLTKLADLHARLDRVIIEAVSWERLFKLYDAPATLWFLDPPYVGGSQKAYSPWTLDQMTTFRDAVRALKGRWIVTVGGTPEMQALWAGHPQQIVTRALGIGKPEDNCRKRFPELIVCDREP